MASFKAPVRTDKDKQIKSIISFATTVQVQLPSAATSKTAGHLFDDLQQQVSTFPNNLKPFVATRCEKIDSIGTTLWNVSTQLRRDYDLDHPDKVPLVLLLVRVFAFLLLEWPNIPGSIAHGNLVRLMKTGLKAVKNCLEKVQFDLALKVLEKLAAYEERLRKPLHETVRDDVEVLNGIVAEYDILRTALAWKQGKLDLAEHIYNKAFSAPGTFDPRSAENLADTLYEIGKDLLSKQQYLLATKWLERSHTVLNAQELDTLSSDANELRISIIQSSIKAWLGMSDQESYRHAVNLANLLEQEIGDKMVVLLIRLELLSAPAAETFDSLAYSEVLQRMTKNMALTEANIKVFLKHMRKLNEKNAVLGCKTLDGFLRLRILRAESQEWVEKIIVTRLWLTVSQRDESDQITPLDDILSAVDQYMARPISPAATVAAHTLLWKRIESNYTQERFDVADSWCRIALHRIFDKSGTVNTARIARKLMLCALGRQDIGSARDIYDSMAEKSKNEPVTIFLMYKIALRCGEIDLASQCLNKVTSQAENINLLYACVLDAQQVGNTAQVLAALQAVLGNIGFDSTSSVHLPALLRNTIRLLIKVIEELKAAKDTSAIYQHTETLCQLFEGATKAMTRASATAARIDNWDVRELDWLSKHSYNLTMRNVAVWHPQHALRTLTCCIFFIDQYPKDIGELVSDNLCFRKMFCAYTAATCLVNLARGEDDIEQQLQYYLRLRKHVHAFDELLQGRLEKLPEPETKDLLRKLEGLMAYDCEAACRLKAWDDLGEIILKAEICKSMPLYLVMADCVLSCQAPTQVVISTLKKIINEAWAIDGLEASMLAKYMRSLFALSIVDNRTIAEEVLGEVQQLAEESAESEQPFPTEEVEWIATNAFNYSIDLYCAGDDEACKVWSAKALNLARYCGDEGRLERTLQTKLFGLRWDVES